MCKLKGSVLGTGPFFMWLSEVFHKCTFLYKGKVTSDLLNRYRRKFKKTYSYVMEKIQW